MAWKQLLAALALAAVARADLLLANASRDVEEEDKVLKINVGGTVFQTLRSTVESSEGSLLSIIFSERWPQPWTRDPKGLVFLDFEPQLFGMLLNYLRTLRHAAPGTKVEPPRPPRKLRKPYEGMLHFLGLLDLLEETSAQAQQAASGPADRALQLVQTGEYNDGGIHVEGGSARVEKWIMQGELVGVQPLLAEGETWKAWKVSLSDKVAGVYAGIKAETASHASGVHAVGVYGWLNNGIYYDGQYDWCGTIWNKPAICGAWKEFQAGDEAVFKLDSQDRSLRMWLRRTKEVYSMRIIEEANLREARVYLRLKEVGSQLEVSPATKEELDEAFGQGEQWAVRPML